MSQELKTTFNGKDGNGGLTLYVNPFEAGKKFYGRFERDVLSMENLISRVQEKNPGTDGIIIQTATSYLKREILAALKEGKAVNLLDLGKLYIAVMGTVSSDAAEEISELDLTVKFAASPVLRESIANVSIGNVILSDTNPMISKIINWFTGEESTALSFGKNVILEGKRLKLGSEDSGIYLAPADEKGDISDEDSSWIDCTGLVRQNTPKRLDFYLPEKATNGMRYRIVIKSNYVNGSSKLKTPVYTYSDVVTITAA